MQLLIRYKSQLASEQSTRNRLENENAEYRRDFTKLQDQVASLTIENNKLRECNNADTNNYHREKVILIEAHNHKINKMEEEIKQIHLKYQEDLKERVDEMNKKYAKSLETVKEMEMNIFRQKLEGEKMRNFSELQKKFIVDIETVRTEERKVATVEIERIRSEYMSKEKETVADLTELERLHTQRVQQLEQQCLLLRTKNGELDDYIKKLENDKFLLVNEHQTITNSYKKKLQDSENQSQLLQVHLRQTEDEIISITSKENKLREDLKQALIDNQLLRAELYEARQQASQGNIHAEQWQRATQESELSITAAKTTAQIAKDEVLMLEHELQRLRDENLSLKDELYRADRVIFGIPQHQSDPRTFLTTIEPELRRSQETNPAFSVGMNATQLIRSETANSVGNKENSRKLTKKALFSPTLPHQPAKGITPATVTRYKPAHTVSSNNKTKKSTTSKYFYTIF